MGILGDFVVNQLAAGAGSHAQLYTINNASDQKIRLAQDAAREIFGDNTIVQAAATAIGTINGANAACSPAVRRSAELIGQSVEGGVRLAGSALIGSPSVVTNTARVLRVAGGALMAGGGAVAAATLPSALQYLPAAASGLVAVYNYLKSPSASAEKASNPEASSADSEESPAFDAAKIAEVKALVKDLNPEEMAELEKMIESLKSEIDPESTWGDTFDSVLDVLQEAVLNTGVSVVSVGLGNVVRLKVINGAYDATVALAGKAAEKSLSALGEGYVASKIRAGAIKAARATAHVFIAPRVATSKTVMALSDKAGEITTKVTAKGLTYAADALTKGPKPKKRSLLRTAARVAGIAAGGAAVACLAPTALAWEVAKRGGVALGKSAFKAYRRHKGDTAEQKAKGALSQAQTALSAYAQGTGSGLDEAKVAAAFVKLAALSQGEQALLAQQLSSASDESVVIAVEEKVQEKATFNGKEVLGLSIEPSALQEAVAQMPQAASAA